MRLQLIAAIALSGAIAVSRAAAQPAPEPAAASAGDGTGSASASASDATGDGSGTDDDLLSEIGQGVAPSDDQGGGTPTTGAGRFGIYTDSDKTQVLRMLATMAKAWGPWSVNTTVGVDAVTSASIDVRSSPALSKPDTVTGASGRTTTSPGKMTDRRVQATLGTGWDDGTGHQAALSVTGAAERDYRSTSLALNGSTDLLQRSTTLLGGVTWTENWIASVLDATVHQRSHAIGWSGGIARVLTPDDALRVHYDGEATIGFQSSPYRSVRFGDWNAMDNSQGQIIFSNTIGSADGLPEKLPDLRVSHAIVVELVHSLAPDVGLHPELRVAHESWGIDSLTASLDLRVARASWRLDVGYRFYIQTHADFFQTKYTLDPSMYTYYTSDKELGDEHSHIVTLDLSSVLREPADDHQSRLLLDARLAGMLYSYPDFALLPSRRGVFAQVGLTWEH